MTHKRLKEAAFAFILKLMTQRGERHCGRFGWMGRERKKWAKTKKFPILCVTKLRLCLGSLSHFYLLYRIFFQPLSHELHLILCFTSTDGAASIFPWYSLSLPGP